MKEWSLKPAAECYWSCNGRMDVTVEPGDIFVIDTNKWQHVTRILEAGGPLSVSLSSDFSDDVDIEE